MPSAYFFLLWCLLMENSFGSCCEVFDLLKRISMHKDLPGSNSGIVQTLCIMKFSFLTRFMRSVIWHQTITSHCIDPSNGLWCFLQTIPMYVCFQIFMWLQLIHSSFGYYPLKWYKIHGSSLCILFLGIKVTKSFHVVLCQIPIWLCTGNTSLQ